MASSTFSGVDEYGFKRPDNFDRKIYEEFMSQYLTILTNRSVKWFKLMKNEERNLKEGSKLRRYIQKGIPSAYRAQVWLKISSIDNLKSKYGSSLFQDKLNAILDPDIVQSIRIDLPRTFPENIYFIPLEGCQQQLYRVLFAFAADKSEIGYCQGLNYIAGLLLLVTRNEENTFWLLKNIVENILPDYYTKSMKGLKVDIEVFAALIKLKLPDLFARIQSLHVPWSLLVMKWFVCLYVEVLPTETVLRIWDCLFYQHSEILFRVGFTIINHNSKALLACEDFTSFMNAFKSMTDDVFVLDCHNFMKVVNNEAKFITNKKLVNLRKEAHVKYYEF